LLVRRSNPCPLLASRKEAEVGEWERERREGRREEEKMSAWWAEKKTGGREGKREGVEGLLEVAVEGEGEGPDEGGVGVAKVEERVGLEVELGMEQRTAFRRARETAEGRRSTAVD
jgi:hypothetical protein